MNILAVALIDRLGLPGWATHGLLLVIVVLVAFLVAQTALAILRRVTSRTQAGWDDAWVSALANPLRLGLVAALLHVSIVQIGLAPKLEGGLALVLSATELVALFWGLYRSVGVIGRTASKSTWAAENPSSAALITLGGRVAGIAVLAGAVITLLSTFGLPVGSLVAGAGLGGLAIGLAAQKSIENLFGGFSLAIDRPCRAGDFVRVEDFVGTVEDVGIRSTRIRTLDRTLITIPNARLSETRIETFAARDRIRLACTLGIEYRTSQAQMREVLEGLRRVLREQPKIWTENVMVRFTGFGASSLDIEVMAWFVTTDWDEFLAIREQVLLEFMGVVEQANTGFAFPTRTIHIASNAASPS
jgi:MscS family membrane protein